jgi:hypothetical protein
MLVNGFVLFVLLVFVNLGVFLPFPLQVGLSGAFRTYSTQGDQFLKIGMMARRALRLG